MGLILAAERHCSVARALIFFLTACRVSDTSIYMDGTSSIQWNSRSRLKERLAFCLVKQAGLVSRGSGGEMDLFK